MPTPRFKQFFLAGTFLAAASAPAFALDSNDLINKLQASYEDYANMTFSYGDVEETGDDGLILKDVVLSPSDDMSDLAEDFEQQAPITLTLEGISENPDGSYLIASARTGAATFMADDITIGFESFSEDNLHVPAVPEISAANGWIYGEKSLFEGITISYKDQPVVTLDQGVSTQSIDATSGDAIFSTDLIGLKTDFTDVEDMAPDVRETLDALDLLKTEGQATMAGSWNAETGDFTLASYDLTLDNVGSLQFSADLTGLSLETLEKLQQLQDMPKPTAMDGNEGDEQASPYTTELMEIGQTIGINGLKIRFVDDSLTVKVLQRVGDTKGFTAEEAADQIEVGLRDSLQSLNMPSLSDMVTTAVGEYFADPQSFTISIEPQMQMPILAVIMAGAAAPQAVPQLLNLQISAND